MLEYDTDMDQLMALRRPKPKPRTNDSIALFKYIDVNILSSLLTIINLLEIFMLH
jgi:hypothetical protein